QTKGMKKVAGTLRLDLANYRALEAFAKFGSDLDKATQSQLNRGARLVELLKQGQYKPIPVERQIVILYVGTQGLLDAVPVNLVLKFEREFLDSLDLKHPEVLSSIATTGAMSDEITAKLKELAQQFVQSFMAGQKK
ncbi:MAG: F0F1 ATP synthase subunit alpha, partial [Rhizobacter sp.]|nr:F0F1 ATP synthase subunit alpha [Chlorobiales bacterium]